MILQRNLQNIQHLMSYHYDPLEGQPQQQDTSSVFQDLQCERSGDPDVAVQPGQLAGPVSLRALLSTC